VASDLEGAGQVIVGSGVDLPDGGGVAEVRGWAWEMLERCRRSGTGRQAICGLDIAMHDLAGQVLGLPVWRLLGAPDVQEIACNATIDAAEPQQAAIHAAAHRTSGFSVFKVKVGTGDDVGRVAAVRATVGDAARIRIDANGAWDPLNAAGMLDELDRYGLELAEQPCRDLAGLVSVRGATAVPIVADESVTSVEEACEAAATRACDAVTIKLSKVGGPLEALRIGAVVPSYLSSSLDGPIGIAAAVHTAQALPRGGYASRFAHGLATLGMFSRLYAPSDGLLGPAVAPPRATGLGVRVDERALQELRIA
jgi:L-alanine-DL-glutamate epimerase-like enolase superfamily enzyme